VSLIKEQMKNAPAKFFKQCHISALAAMKMLKHALVGVEEGLKSENKMTYEVMGFLVGKPEGESYVIMDTIPSPAKGFENNVELTNNAMLTVLKQADQLEKKRNERIVGWYHSHPFAVDVNSFCFLSNTDVRCQRNQQLAIPDFVAIVIDPLRSMARQEPEIGAFRTLPRDYKMGEEECPDGTVMGKEAKAKRWGNSSNEYYALKVNYFMSTLGRAELGVMSKNNLWLSVLGSTPMLEAENRTSFANRVRKASEKLQSAANSSMGGGRGGFGGYGAPLGPPGARKADSELSQGSQACAEIAMEALRGHATQISKDLLFNNPALARKSTADRKEVKKEEKKA